MSLNRRAFERSYRKELKKGRLEPALQLAWPQGKAEYLIPLQIRIIPHEAEETGVYNPLRSSPDSPHALKLALPAQDDQLDAAGKLMQELLDAAGERGRVSLDQISGCLAKIIAAYSPEPELLAMMGDRLAKYLYDPADAAAKAIIEETGALLADLRPQAGST